MKPGQNRFVAGFALLLLAFGAGASAPGAERSPYGIYPRYYNAVRAVIEGRVPKEKAMKAFDKLAGEVLAEAAGGAKKDEICELFCLRKALEVFSATEEEHKETALLLLDRPDWCGRFVYALDEDDKLNGALRVLEELRAVDEKEFERKFEFCLAFAVVWDDFQGYWWVDKYTDMPENAMLDLYRFYLKNERKMLFRPGQLPFELNIFVVDTRLTAAEREWVLHEYSKRTLREPYDIYKSVPWTLNDAKTVSHGHQAGLDVPYTLMNIKAIGGCCMEQAYYTSSVYRLFGVPAVYTRGRGKRGGHAWAGVLLTRSGLHWDFDAGRYDSDHYYKGEVYDPTAMNKHRVASYDEKRRVRHVERVMINDSEVKMTAALLEDAGSIKKLCEANHFLAAARWGEAHLPETVDEKGRIGKMDVVRRMVFHSLNATAFNPRVWYFLSDLASEKKMDPDRAFFWTKKMVEMTVKDYPDFTVDCLDGFMTCLDDNKRKLAACDVVYKALEKSRVDLACEVKIREADIWMEEGQVARAVYAYIYPLVNFAEDQHILERAKAGLAKLAENLENDKELEKAYWRILKVGKHQARKDARTAQGIVNMAYAKLAQIYRRRGDTEKAMELESKIVK